MTFTADVKKEIIARGIKGAESEKAALSAFVRTSGILTEENGIPGFSIISETEHVAEFFTALFADVFQAELSVSGASMDKMSGRDKLTLVCPKENSEIIIRELGLSARGGGFAQGIPARFSSGGEATAAYIKGAFLGSGSCIVPGQGGGKTGYHLEFVFQKKRIAEDFCCLLGREELLAKGVERGGASVVYIKSKEMISDFLSVVGAENSLKKFASLVGKRDESNNSNRAANCFSGNADKAATAAVRQVLAIEKIYRGGGGGLLCAELAQTARARIDNPALSLQELADLLKISKSCLTHRLRKLEETAAKAELSSADSKINERKEESGAQFPREKNTGR